MKGLIETTVILVMFAAMVLICWRADHRRNRRNKQLTNRTKKEKDHA